MSYSDDHQEPFRDLLERKVATTEGQDQEFYAKLLRVFDSLDRAESELTRQCAKLAQRKAEKAQSAQAQATAPDAPAQAPLLSRPADAGETAVTRPRLPNPSVYAPLVTILQ